MRRLLILFLILPALAMAAEGEVAKPASPVANSDIASQLLQMLFGLALVIGLILLMAWLMRRVQRVGPRGGQVIKLVATQALGPRDRLVLVQVGGEQVLLGLTSGRITPLHVLKEPVSLADAEAATPEFAQRLMELLGKDTKDKT
ncbi:flagellar biosynthetic protein FliO [Pseudomonas sp. LRF_L74]|uniref:flagellar biosynthetic protein FliO n=1 Tax=Pseudomonas sp. LRF_L74 TaxID=3369422 RepID=UPI003F5DAEA3